MRAYILIILLVVQMTTATLTIDKITEKVHAGLKTLKEKAVSKLHKLKQEIDVKKLHQLDVLHLLPYAHKHFVHEHYSKKTPLIVDHHQIQRLKHYFEAHHKPVHHHVEHHPAPIHFHHLEHKPLPLHHHHVEPLKPAPLHYHHVEHFEHLKV